MLVMTVGQTTAAANTLREKLTRHQVPCASFSTVTVEEALRSLSQSTTKPDVVFYQCSGVSLQDHHAISQLRAKTPSEIAPVGSLADPRVMLDFIRHGATDFLQDSDHFGNDVDALISRLRCRREKAHRGLITSVVSVNGGCGASTIAINLCAGWAKEHRRAALIELKINGGDCAAMLDLQTQHTISDLCQDSIDVDVEMLEKSMASHASGIHLLASPALWDDYSPISPQAGNNVIRLAASSFPHVVVDLQDVFHSEQFAAIQASDSIMVVLRLELPCLIRTRQILNHLEEQGIDRDSIHLVVNRYDPKAQLKKHQVVEALGHPISYCLPEDYTTAVVSSNIGNPVVDECPGSRLAAELQQMSSSIYA